jgi:hypothetical protein
MNQQPLEIRIDELVLDGVAHTPRLSVQVAEAVSAALVERGLPPATAARTSIAVGREAARAVSGVRAR